MEVSIQKDGLRLKSKQATFLINPTGSIGDVNAVAFLSDTDKKESSDDSVVLSGAGDYEIGGVKITGARTGNQIIYTFLLDGVNVLLGRISPLEKIQNKVKESEIVVLLADDPSIKDAAFVTGLATNVLIAYGSEAKSLIESMAKDNSQTMNKFVSTRDKLPQEMQTILLANS